MSQIRIIKDDCMAAVRKLAAEGVRVDAVITDPPYFLDKMADGWDTDALAQTTTNGQVTSLPSGMKFDPRQGLQFQEFMQELATECLAILKPGGFFLAFSAPRLVHRLGVGIEDAGYHIRDMWSWLYTQNQMKAMRVTRFLARKDIPDDLRAQLEAQLEVWKTPQIKSCFEPIVCAQRPPEGTFLDNWVEHGVGLVNTEARVGADQSMFPANVISTAPISEVLDRTFAAPESSLGDWDDAIELGDAFLCSKPSKTEKGDFNNHKSVKPLPLMEQLVRIVTQPDALVLDPFNGSGTTGVAAVNAGRRYIGVELLDPYIEITKERFKRDFTDPKLSFAKTRDGGFTARFREPSKAP